MQPLEITGYYNIGVIFHHKSVALLNLSIYSIFLAHFARSYRVTNKAFIAET